MSSKPSVAEDGMAEVSLLKEHARTMDAKTLCRAHAPLDELTAKRA